MKRGKDEDKTRGPMFPRLHVNDTEKGGPRAPPRNKMALYEQLSIPSQRFNGGVPSSSTRAIMNERGTYSSLQKSSSKHPIKKPETRQSDYNNDRVQQERKRRQEDDHFTVPIFDQQSKQNDTKFQKENSQDFPASTSNQPARENTKASSKETNNRNVRNRRVDLQADNTLWGDSVLNEASKASGYENNSVPLREVQKEDGDAVSENSMVDSICGVDISPDDVVGIIGQKHFWKARRAIVNQQRVFAVQVFELHRLIKVQRLIAGSPHLLVEENAYITKPPKVSPIKKIPIEYITKPTIDAPKKINDLEKPNNDMEFSAENAVRKVSLSSVQNGSQTTNCRPFGGHPLPSDQNMGSWNFNPPPGPGPGPGPQWLIPVMSPSEGLVYKPYPAPGFMNPVYGGCGPLGSMPGPGYNMSSYGASPHHHYYDGSLGVNPFTPLPASHGYFPAYGMQMANTVDPIKPFNQGSITVQTEKNVQASTASSRSDKTKDQNALPLFPTSPPAHEPPRVVEIVGPSRVIRVVPHNARSATASVARIFQSIQEERKQHDSD